MKRLIHNLSYLVSVILFILAVIIIHHKLKQYHYHDIIAQLGKMPSAFLFLAAALTILNYLVLTFYDTLALRYVHHPLKYRKIAPASFIGYVFSINATILGGSAARYRIYSALGVSAGEVVRLVIFCSLTFWLGFFTIGGMAFIFGHQDIPAALHLPFASVWPVGVVFLVIVAGYVATVILRKAPMKIRGWEFAVPTLPVALGQIAIASLDLALASAVLYVLLPSTMGLTYPKFLSIFLLAQLAGLISFVPGGLGVFESVILLLLSQFGEASAVIGSLVIYRLVYYILPLGAGSILLASYEVLSRKIAVKRIGVVLEQWSSAMIPHVLAYATFVSGVILLFSGTLPAVKGRLEWLRDLLPIPAIELSHFLGSLIGAALLILARGLQRRLDAAYHITVIFLGAGIALSLLKGLDYEEAIILTIMLLVFLPCRRHFYRKASLLNNRFTAGWIALIIAIMFSTVWLGMFSYKHVDYSNQLWWQFTIHGNASRFLRATSGAAIVVLLYAAMKLFAPGELRQVAADRGNVEEVESIVKNSRKTYANLALLGDKKFVFSEKQNAFIMYAVEGRSWIAMGDPVGREDEWNELIWRFAELCDRYDGWPVFYQVETTHLNFYLDIGMTFLKLGEEARVDLRSFSLEGSSRKGLRYEHRKVEKENCSFEIVSVSDVPFILGELKAVSDAWLAEKNTKEKHFSLGFFNAEYLKRFPAAVVHKGEKIIAFANVWQGAQKEELSIDLMRHLPNCPEGIMDYLFVELMLWGRQEGYQWFNFGMAPLSGLEDRALAPFWSKAGAFVFRFGEHFYNFQGLRQYKEKFDPEWHPKYLVCPKGLMLPRILTNIAVLISGGIKGIIAK